MLTRAASARFAVGRHRASLFGNRDQELVQRDVRPPAKAAGGGLISGWRRFVLEPRFSATVSKAEALRERCRHSIFISVTGAPSTTASGPICRARLRPVRGPPACQAGCGAQLARARPPVTVVVTDEAGIELMSVDIPQAPRGAA